MTMTVVLQDAANFFKTPFKTHKPCFQDTLSRRSFKTPFKTPWKFLLDTPKKQNFFQDACFFFQDIGKSVLKTKKCLGEPSWKQIKCLENLKNMYLEERLEEPSWKFFECLENIKNMYLEERLEKCLENFLSVLKT